MTVTTTIPVRTSNPLNGSWGHWRPKAAMRKRQRAAAAVALCAAAPGAPVGAYLASGCVVSLTRIAPSRGLDDDALPAALKSIRDGLADWLGLADDRDPRVRWLYDQKRGVRGEYAVAVEVRPMDATERRLYGVEAA